MSGPDQVQAAVLGVFAALALMGVLLGLLSRWGLLNHDGWAVRDPRPEPEPQPTAPRRVPADTYREPPLRELVDRAHHDAVAGAACPLTCLPVSPDPRRKES